MKARKRFFILLALVVFGCSQEPKPIEFGQDGCSYCKMTIVDKNHAAELVTEKGKVYKYDSIECMIRSLSTLEAKNIKFYVMDFANPGTFIDATSATFLISESIPSPMGANLSAFKSEEKATEFGVDGTIFEWNSIRNHIR